MPAASSREDTPAGFQQTPPRRYHASPSILSHTHHPSPRIQISFITRCCSWQTKGTGRSPGFCHSTTTNSPALASLEKESKPACFSLQALQQVNWITGPYSSLSKTSIKTGKWFLSMRLRGQAGTRGWGPMYMKLPRHTAATACVHAVWGSRGHNDRGEAKQPWQRPRGPQYLLFTTALYFTLMVTVWPLQGGKNKIATPVPQGPWYTAILLINVSEDDFKSSSHLCSP